MIVVLILDICVWTKLCADRLASQQQLFLSLSHSLSIFSLLPLLPACIMSAPPRSLGPNAQRRYYPPNSNASSTTSLLPPSQDMPRRQSPKSPNPPMVQIPGSNFQPMSAPPTKSATPSLRSSASNLSLVSFIYRPVAKLLAMMTFTPQFLFFLLRLERHRPLRWSNIKCGDHHVFNF